MIDKVDLRISEFAQPGPAIAKEYERLKRQPNPLFRPSRFYKYVCDLREPFGIDAVIHLECRNGRPNHKLEILDTGKKTIREMAEIVAQVFDVEPWDLSLMRVDLAADIEGVSVPWFQDHAFVNRKQFSSRIEKSHDFEVQFVGMGNAVSQTLYAGKRPNLIRIYNKLAELLLQHRRIEREYNRFNEGLKGLDLTSEQAYYGALVAPSFKEYCLREGYEYQEGNTLTRIERQIGGNRFPPELATLGDLRYAHEFDPFTALRIVGSGPIRNIESPPRDIPLRNFLAAVGYETVQQRLGSAQLAQAFVLKHGNGNGKRILASIAECAIDKRQPLSIDEIQESFRESTRRQTLPAEAASTFSPPPEMKSWIA